jgi:hypothetical protein
VSGASLCGEKNIRRWLADVGGRWRTAKRRKGERAMSNDRAKLIYCLFRMREARDALADVGVCLRTTKRHKGERSMLNGCGELICCLSQMREVRDALADVVETV